jgi:hypothetical protein
MLKKTINRLRPDYSEVVDLMCLLTMRPIALFFCFLFFFYGLVMFHHMSTLKQPNLAVTFLPGNFAL